MRCYCTSRAAIRAMIMVQLSGRDEDLARVVGSAILEHLVDAVPGEFDIEVIEVRILAPVGGGGVRFALHRDVVAFAEDGAPLHIESIGHHRFEAPGKPFESVL